MEPMDNQWIHGGIYCSALWSDAYVKGAATASIMQQAFTVPRFFPDNVRENGIFTAEDAQGFLDHIPKHRHFEPPRTTSAASFMVVDVPQPPGEDIRLEEGQEVFIPHHGSIVANLLPAMVVKGYGNPYGPLVSTLVVRTRANDRMSTALSRAPHGYAFQHIQGAGAAVELITIDQIDNFRKGLFEYLYTHDKSVVTDQLVQHLYYYHGIATYESRYTRRMDRGKTNQRYESEPIDDFRRGITRFNARRMPTKEYEKYRIKLEQRQRDVEEEYRHNKTLLRKNRIIEYYDLEHPGLHLYLHRALPQNI